ncbi:hypothetical protein V2J09_013180 [Rumex salicifolius]
MENPASVRTVSILRWDSPQFVSRHGWRFRHPRSMKDLSSGLVMQKTSLLIFSKAVETWSKREKSDFCSKQNRLHLQNNCQSNTYNSINFCVQQNQSFACMKVVGGPYSGGSRDPYLRSVLLLALVRTLFTQM